MQPARSVHMHAHHMQLVASAVVALAISPCLLHWCTIRCGKLLKATQKESHKMTRKSINRHADTECVFLTKINAKFKQQSTTVSAISC